MKHSLIKRVIVPVLLLGLVLGTPLAAAPASAADDLQQNETALHVSGDEQQEAEPAADNAPAEKAQQNVSSDEIETAQNAHQSNSSASETAAPAKRNAPAPQDEPSGREVATKLTLSGPEGDVYEGDPVTFTARLTDESGNGIGGKNITLNSSGTRDGLTTHFGSTDQDGYAAITINDGFEEGAHSVFVEFKGDASEWGGKIYSKSELDKSKYVYLTVKPAEQKPAEQKDDPSEVSGENQIPTTVSITNCSKDDWNSTSNYTIYEFNIAAFDQDGNPVDEDIAGYNNIELHIIDANGEDVVTANLDPAGKYNEVGTAQIKKQLVSGEYEIYVKYVGRGNYTSSESLHYTLNLKDDGSLDLLVLQTGEDNPSETGQPADDPQAGDDQQTGDQPQDNPQTGDDPSETGQPADDPQTGDGQDPGTAVTTLPPVIINGEGQSVTEGTKTRLAFRSNAAFSDFVRVEVDGKTLDPGNYAAAEGSTIVTLEPEYVASLTAGTHTLGIVSQNGTAETTFTVNAAETEPSAPSEPAAQNGSAVPSGSETVNEPAVRTGSAASAIPAKLTGTGGSSYNVPKTGDDSNMAIWIVLIAVCGSVLAGTEIYRKKKS